MQVQTYELRVQVHELWVQCAQVMNSNPVQTHEFKNHLINENPSKKFKKS